MGNQASVNNALACEAHAQPKPTHEQEMKASRGSDVDFDEASPVTRSASSTSSRTQWTGLLQHKKSFEQLTSWLSGSPRTKSDAMERSTAVDLDKQARELTSAKRKIQDWYDVDRHHIGRGHYAVVCRGKCRRTGRPVAVKKIKRFLTDEKRLKAEICVLKRVKKHPNIVELIDVFETPREVHVVMELCTGGELFERLADKGPYSEADCVRHLSDMAKAVQYLHENGIVHRDLKPENILLSTPNDEDAVVKVADFGLAKVFTGTNMKTKCGTWGYSAPEMISGSGISFGYDSKVDSWSLGTILYILLCGFHPFDPNGTSSDNDMISAIKNCNFDFQDDAWIGISDGAKDLIRHLLVLDPAKRFTMAEILNHHWVTGALEAPSLLPLSPTIHRDLAKYRAHSKQRLSYELFEEEGGVDEVAYALSS